MILKYMNLELNLEENIEKLQQEIEELKKLENIIKNSVDMYILEGKTQLIGKNQLQNNRNRRQHTEAVGAIAKRTIRLLYETAVDDEIKETKMYKLNLTKELLYAQIIADAHDLGHTPFGHLGERVLNKCFQQSKMTKEELKETIARRKKMYGEEYELNQGHDENFTGNISFEHNEQSAKLLYNIVQNSRIDTKKINVNRIIQGILSHSVSRVQEENIPNDLVVQVIRQSDKIEYINNDYDEVANLINLGSINNLELIEFLQDANGQPIKKDERIKETIQQLVEEILKKGYVNDSMDCMKTTKQLKNLYQRILFAMDTDGKRGLLTGENVEKITLMLIRIYDYYKNNPEQIRDEFTYRIRPVNKKGTHIKSNVSKCDLQEDIPLGEKIINYISRMDNQRVENEYQALLQLRILKGKGYGIEPITLEEIEEVKRNFYNQRVQMEKLKQEMDGTEHSEEECEGAIKLSIAKLKQNFLTQVGRDRLEQARQLDDKENEEILGIQKLIKIYDNNPKIRQHAIDRQKGYSKRIFGDDERGI